MIVGYDTWTSGNILKNNLVSDLSTESVSVLDAGIFLTLTLAFAAKKVDPAMILEKRGFEVSKPKTGDTNVSTELINGETLCGS